ncbi:nucleotidyl transferase AbiEii/AbiGii toxin family protein [Acrocarpospora catenulata]|uniref:nucleotidyl transferase AbiEii/AbiGii toxin family protein n=1 Tax=Acrocarpospora catenulata TaxID=2836182 RepID=UPI001BD9EF10|nr:nucleotidyl transferase AbiEii/AbiGii toxin family protein [Acrocarpospora catenulata]
MTTSWDDYSSFPWVPEGWIPERGEEKFPTTYLPVTIGAGTRQKPIFDPALKQFERAYRAGEPEFDAPETGRRWRTARRHAIDLVLEVISGSVWSEHLVLRGSLLLEAWIGDIARDPGDLDFVVVPAKLTLDSPEVAAMFRDLVEGVTSRTLDGVRLDPADVAVDDIWTYDRVPGRRLVFTWHADGLPPGTVQLDFVCGEKLPVPPQVTGIPRAGGGEPTPILGATPELSLAWKILWLVTDMHAQGKDLYDAVLLAERVTLPPDLLTEVLDGEPFDAGMIRGLGTEWEEFRAEYPQVPGDQFYWRDRLADALGLP